MSITDDINCLKDEIQGLFTSEQNMHPNLIDLRNKTFNAHAIVESLIETSICNRLIFLAHRDNEVSDKIFDVSKLFLEEMVPVLEMMKFSAKLEFAKKVRAVEIKSYKVINELNTIRNDLAHPLRRNCKQYESDKGYKRALEVILDALSEAYSNDGVVFGDVIADLIDKQLQGNSSE